MYYTTVINRTIIIVGLTLYTCIKTSQTRDKKAATKKLSALIVLVRTQTSVVTFSRFFNI